MSRKRGTATKEIEKHSSQHKKRTENAAVLYPFLCGSQCSVQGISIRTANIHLHCTLSLMDASSIKYLILRAFATPVHTGQPLPLNLVRENT